MLSKAQQEAEAEARKQAQIEPGETRRALDVVDDTPAPQAETAVPGDSRQAAEARQKSAPAEPPASVRRREEIIARYRAKRRQNLTDESAEDVMRASIPPEFAGLAQAPQHAAANPEPDTDGADPAEAAETDDAAAAASEENSAGPKTEEPRPERPPQTVKLKVNGEIKELPLDEVIAKAQIALAAGDILGEAKQLRQELNTLLSRTKGAAPAQPGHHAEAEQEPAEPSAPQPGQPDQDPWAQVVEKIQFGDPAEARALLQQTIAQETARQVAASLREQRLRDEGARSMQVLSEYEKSHPEIATDDMARAAIESRVIALQVEDLKALGVDINALRRADGSPANTPADIAQAHRYYRAEGFKVRSPQQLLQQATEDFLAWKGTAQASAPVRQGAPRIEVSQERVARRQAVPQQPSRTVAPKPAPAAPQTRSRSDIVQEMMAARMKPRTPGIPQNRPQ